MKFGWKDFFYFQQSEKRAILLLLILIFICLGTAVVYDSFLNREEMQQQEENLAEFQNFQNNLQEKQDVELLEEKIGVEPKKSTKSGNLPKLLTGETIELNGAGITTIKRIPGIGDEYAKRIVDYHNQLGGFVFVEQLMEVQGITANRFNKISPYVRLQKKAKKLSINKATQDEFSRHPYINAEQAQAIVDLRQKAGRVKSVEDLMSVSAFTPRDIDRLQGYLSFD